MDADLEAVIQQHMKQHLKSYLQCIIAVFLCSLSVVAMLGYQNPEFIDLEELYVRIKIAPIVLAIAYYTSDFFDD